MGHNLEREKWQHKTQEFKISMLVSNIIALKTMFRTHYSNAHKSIIENHMDVLLMRLAYSCSFFLNIKLTNIHRCLRGELSMLIDMKVNHQTSKYTNNIHTWNNRGIKMKDQSTQNINEMCKLMVDLQCTWPPLLSFFLWE